MSGWLSDVKDSDKVGLLLLFTGLSVSLLGTVAAMFILFYMRNESNIDRGLAVVATLGAQGGGLVTAAMGVLRFQSKSDNPPPTDVVKTQTTVSTTVPVADPPAPAKPTPKW
jgi:hypothetical protein